MTFFSFLFKKKFPNALARDQIAASPFTLWKLFTYLLAIALVVLIYIIIIRVNDKFLVTIPARGGTLTEGIIGAPHTIDPLGAVTDTDVAFTHLVYAGLMKEEGDGSVVPELAKDYAISPDGRTYTFTLKDKLMFSDKTPLTSADVAATIAALQDPVANPRTGSYWQNVAISTPNDSTVIATLQTPDDGFLTRMSIGIMKASLLQKGETPQQSADTAANKIDLSPIGAGPFVLDNVSYDETGTPKLIHFVRNKHYVLGSPLLSALDVVVYANQDALLRAVANDDINVTFALAPETLTPKDQPTDATFTAIPTNNTIGLWQLSSSELSSESLRATLNRFIDKSGMIATIENGYGISLTDTTSVPLSLEDAQNALSKSGYAVKNGVLTRSGTPVTLSIATSNDPKLLATAHAITESLAALGTMTQVLAFDHGTLADDVAQQKLPLVLSDGTLSLPSAYTLALPLYISAAVVASDDSAHAVTPKELISPVLRYADVTAWHVKVDRVWPFLVRNR